MAWGSKGDSGKGSGGKDKGDLKGKLDRLARNDRDYGRNNPKNPNNKPNGK